MCCNSQGVVAAGGIVLVVLLSLSVRRWQLPPGHFVVQRLTGGSHVSRQCLASNGRNRFDIFCASLSVEYSVFILYTRRFIYKEVYGISDVLF